MKFCVSRVLLVALAFIVQSPGQQTLQISGAGATFPYPLYTKWFASFEQRHPGVHFEYRATGSEQGIQDLAAGRIDFAASDVPLTDDQSAKLGLKLRQVPTLLGAVVIAYHLENMTQDLRFTPEVLASIFLGKIVRWNDPALRAINRGASLPNQPIRVIHRSDGSGTTYVLSDFLAKTAPEWKLRFSPATSLDWPVGTGASGNQGVAEAIAKTPFSIGYVEFIYSLENRLSIGLVRNATGKFLSPGLESITAAALHAVTHDLDLRTSITDAPTPGAYSIASFSYLLLPQETSDPKKRELLQEFVQWVLTSGQKQSASLGYAALPSEVASKAQRLLTTK